MRDGIECAASGSSRSGLGGSWPAWFVVPRLAHASTGWRVMVRWSGQSSSRLSAAATAEYPPVFFCPVSGVLPALVVPPSVCLCRYCFCQQDSTGLLALASADGAAPGGPV